MLFVAPALRWGWDKDLYVRAGGDDEAGFRKEHIDLDKVDKCDAEIEELKRENERLHSLVACQESERSTAKDKENVYAKSTRV